MSEEIAKTGVFNKIAVPIKINDKFSCSQTIIIEFSLSFIIRSVIVRMIISPICLKSFDYKPNHAGGRSILKKPCLFEKKNFKYVWIHENGAKELKSPP